MRTCDVCNVEFEPSTTRQKYCSHSCRSRLHNAKPAAKARRARAMRESYAARSAVAFIVCRFCNQLSTVRSSRATVCLRKECRRAQNAERMRGYSRRGKAETGEWPARKYEKRAQFVCAGGCGAAVRRSPKGGASTCQDCRNKSGQTAQQYRVKVQLEKAARGTSSEWVWCQGVCAECGETFVRHREPSPFCSSS